MGQAKFTRFKRDRAGVAQILKSPGVDRAVRGKAQAIAAAVRGSKPEADVVVDSYVTDRAAASVTIRDVRGRIWEVRDGILTRAARTVGMEVRRK